MKHVWIGLWLALFFAASCQQEPALVGQLRKERLINAIQRRLLESVDAEKSAVLSTTDAESEALAHEARRLEEDINNLRAQLQPLVVADKRYDEADKLAAFDAAWGELADVDKRLLTLAVANTNLKALRLSARDGAAAVDHFVAVLAEAETNIGDAPTIRALARASVAALREQNLLLVHIPTADEDEMTKLEKEMNESTAAVEQGLNAARDSGHLPPQQVAAAATAWDDYRRVAVDVVRLSRENTNVRSFDISIHEKRKATKDCLNALSALLTAVQSGQAGTR